MTEPTRPTPDHEFIWLQNAEDANSDGRLWCEDKIWPDEPEEGEPTKYIRADLVATAIQAAVDEAYEDAIKSLDIYHDVPPEHESEPDPFHWGWELAVRKCVRAIRSRKSPPATEKKPE